jgi:hypothetical protein
MYIVPEMVASLSLSGAEPLLGRPYVSDVAFPDEWILAGIIP